MIGCVIRRLLETTERVAERTPGDVPLPQVPGEMQMPQGHLFTATRFIAASEVSSYQAARASVVRSSAKAVMA